MNVYTSCFRLHNALHYTYARPLHSCSHGLSIAGDEMLLPVRTDGFHCSGLSIAGRHDISLHCIVSLLQDGRRV